MCQRISAAAVAAWPQDNRAPERALTLISLKLLVFSGVAPKQRQPLVTLRRPDYALISTADY